MTQWFLSINKGQLDAQTGNVLVATTAPTADFYLQILSTNSPTKKDTMLAMQAFRNYFLADGIPGGQRGVDIPPL